MPNRRFPPPWSVEDIGACCVVTDGVVAKVSEVSDFPNCFSA